MHAGKKLNGGMYPLRSGYEIILLIFLSSIKLILGNYLLFQKITNFFSNFSTIPQSLVFSATVYFEFAQCKKMENLYRQIFQRVKWFLGLPCLYGQIFTMIFP